VQYVAKNYRLAYVAYGVFFLLIMIPAISQGALQKPRGQILLIPLLFFAIANGILGFGLLKMHKWGLYGTIVFGILMILWCTPIRVVDPFYSAGLIFYLIVVISLIPKVIKDFSKK
jgi:hypothetical protein